MPRGEGGESAVSRTCSCRPSDRLKKSYPLCPHSPDAHVHVVPARKCMLSVPEVNGYRARLARLAAR